MKYFSFITFLSILICLSSCDKGYFALEMNHPKTFSINFLNEEGEDIASKIDFKWDTVQVDFDEKIILSPDEYTLKLLVNGEEKEPQLIFNAGQVKFLEKPLYSFIFSYPEGEGGNLEKKKSYTFEYLFSCPKLFGNDKIHSIRVMAPWVDGYHPLLRIYFDEELISDKRNEIIVSVVLKNHPE